MADGKRASTPDQDRKARELAEAEAARRADPARPAAGGGAGESRRGSEPRGRDEAARPSEGGAAGESDRAGETIPSREDEAAGALSDDPAPPASRPSAEP